MSPFQLPHIIFMIQWQRHHVLYPHSQMMLQSHHLEVGILVFVKALMESCIINIINVAIPTKHLFHSHAILLLLSDLLLHPNRI